MWKLKQNKRKKEKKTKKDGKKMDCMNTLKLSDLHIDSVLGLIKALPVKIKYSHKREHKASATRNCKTNTVLALHGNTHSHLLEKYTMF
jgi:hypothetical protein